MTGANQIRSSERDDVVKQTAPAVAEGTFARALDIACPQAMRSATVSISRLDA